MDGEYSTINSTMVGNRIISINKNIYEISDVWIWKNISKGFHIWNSIARIISQLYMKRSKTNRIKNAVKSGNCKNQPFKDDSICNVRVLYWSLKKYVKIEQYIYTLIGISINLCSILFKNVWKLYFLGANTLCALTR